MTTQLTPEEQKIKEEMMAEEAKKSNPSEDKKEEGEKEIPTEEEPSEEESPKEESLKVDYDAELVKERERRKKAEEKLEETQRKASERREWKLKQEREEESDEEERPMTASEMRALLAEEREATRKEFQSTRITEIARSMAASESEAQLIVEIHKNRSFPSTLSLEEQLEESYAIANRKRIMAQREELVRALHSKETRVIGGGQYRDSVMTTSEPKLGAADIQAIKSAGFVWDAQQRLYKKSLAKGKNLFFDPKTHKRFVR